MFTALTLAAVLLGQTPPATQVPPTEEPSRVDDVIVDGRSVVDQARDFVSEVAAPVNNRNLATWHGALCIGAANMGSVQHAQAMVDRVSEVALSLGLRPGEPGCEPNVLVIMTTDASAMAAELVERRPRTFRPNYTGAAQGRDELDAFIETDAPVRWWHISIPVDAATGTAAVRMPGGEPPIITKRPGASRLRSPLRDDMRKAFIIIDVDGIAEVSFAQLSDYVAFLVLAQTDPEADTSRYDTILNLFKGAPQQGLTAWDQAYLRALYSTDTTNITPNRHGSEVGRDLARELAAADRTSQVEGLSPDTAD
jgi:hypothetical protein